MNRLKISWCFISLAMLLFLGCAVGEKNEVLSRRLSRPLDKKPVSQTVPAQAPVYLSLLDNLNDFVFFANGGGWDAKSYIGYNMCWVVKLPPAPAGDYEKAFLGAKIGRMKMEPIPGRPKWEKRPVRGSINIAVASEPIWPHSQRHLLAKTVDIPLEGEKTDAVEGVGESRWFWVEVPVKSISSTQSNYVAVFSPSKSLYGAARCPILAAGPSDQNVNAWLNNSVKGQPPFNSRETLKTKVHYKPAVAVKLVPSNNKQVKVSLREKPLPDTVIEDKIVFSASVLGEDIQNAWVEFSTDTKNWIRATSPLWNAPYIFTVKRARLLEGDNQVRVTAVDAWENRGFSESVNIKVINNGEKKLEIGN